MRKILLTIAAALICGAAFADRAIILNAATATGGGPAFTVPLVNGLLPPVKTYTVIGTSAQGTGTLVLAVEGSWDGAHWDSSPIGTVTMTVTTSGVSTSFTSQDHFPQLRGNPTTINGTGTAATLGVAY